MATMSPGEHMKCEFFDLQQCGEGNSNGCNSTEVCEIPETGKRAHCYALWRNDSGLFALQKKVSLSNDNLARLFSFLKTK